MKLKRLGEGSQCGYRIDVLYSQGYVFKYLDYAFCIVAYDGELDTFMVVDLEGHDVVLRDEGGHSALTDVEIIPKEELRFDDK